MSGVGDAGRGRSGHDAGGRAAGSVRDAFATPELARHRVAARFRAHRLAREKRALARLVAELPPGPRLDLACGVGTMADVLGGAAPLVGVDGSPAMCAEARAVAAYRGVVVADATRLPFRDGAFVSAAVVRLLHHLDGAARRAVLAELARVVTARAVVSFFDAATLEAWRAARRRRARGSRHAIPLAELERDLVATGWRRGGISRKLGRLTEHVYVLAERA